MKKKYLYIEFAIIFIIFVVPPLFTNPESQTSIANGGFFSPQAIIQIALSALILYQNKKNYPQVDFENKKREKFSNFILFMTWWPLCLGGLMLCQGAMTGISMLTGIKSTKILLPETICQWIIYFFNLTAAVFYEETIYRLYLPESLLSFANGKSRLKFAMEIICVLIFAFSHRYLGWIAVLNAAICGGILRISKIKSKSIGAPLLAHFLYNIIQTIMVANLKI